VENCSFTGYVSGQGNTDGVVQNNYGMVQNCSFTGNVSSSSNVGGVVQLNNPGGTVKNCYVTGYVSSKNDDNYAGGVAQNNQGTIQNCYFAGDISGSTVGGVVAYNDGGGTAYNCVAIKGNVQGNASTAGRIFGTLIFSQSNNYSDMTVNDLPVSGTSTGKNGANIMPSNYNNETWWKTAANWNTPADAWFGANNDSWEWDGGIGGTNLPKLKNVGVQTN
jgi:hypothetical protein